MEKLFGSSDKVLPLHIVRRLNDMSDVFCARENESKHEIVRIGLHSDAVSRSVKVQSYFEINSAHISYLEFSAQNAKNLLVLDDEQNIHSLFENAEGKGSLDWTVDMANHDLKDEIVMLQQKPWSSLAICERAISILDFSFSLGTKFFWKAERDSADT